MQFKTNINCGGCIAKVTPFLDEAAGAGKWSVDTANPDKVLTVENETLSAEDIQTGLDKLGYHAEAL
ncbi:hypothetical protein [Paludibacter sp.]|uniref:heavy-metal-associated domain-containing protein n=1 Tax=Paludibacter sp. TaxID=1898105 RepID=UPI0025EEA428|nr:hypothetical protein [Paludibacter sp.]